MQALVLGGVAWNTMIYVDQFPEPVPQTVFGASSHTTVGSSGAGKALNLASLGVDVTLWGLIGDDDSGDRVRRFIGDAGIDFVTQHDPAGTMRHVNLMDAAGDRISIFVNNSSNEIDVDPTVIADTLASADVVNVTIMNSCRQFLPLIQNAGKSIWVDIHDYDGVNPHHDEFIEAADYLLMSTLAMENWRGFAQSRVAAGASAVLCTQGAEGAWGLTAEEGWIHVPAVPITRVVDTNGAGDGFFAGFATAWHAGSGLEEAMRAGATQAARVIQSPNLAPAR